MPWPMGRTRRDVWCILESCLRHLPIHGQDGGLQAGAPDDIGIEQTVFLNASRMAPGQLQTAARLHLTGRQSPDFRSLGKQLSLMAR
ncbi:MAG: hypothetical protein VB858_12130 [Planctomycetaceae bacterium]